MHAATQFTAALEYETQSGALNESVSDVFRPMIKQWKEGQTIDQADWLMGKGILFAKTEWLPELAKNAYSLRSLKDLEATTNLLP